MMYGMTHHAPRRLGGPPLALPLEDVRREMDRLVTTLGRGLVAPLGHATWPRSWLTDTGDALVFRAEVPGFSEADLDVTVHDGTLVVRGKRADCAESGWLVHRRERAVLDLSRSVALPCEVDVDRAEARLADGVLVLTLPKAPEAQPRKIAVQSR